MNKIFKQFLYILGLSIALGFIRYLTLDDFSLINYEKKSNLNMSLIDLDLQNYLINLESPEIIPIDIAKNIYDQKLGIFIDSRDESDFNLGHVKGSINIPYDPDDNYNYSLIDSLYNLDQSLVIYCSGEGCSLSSDLAYSLYEKGFLSITYFEEGLPVWKELEYPYSLISESKTIDDDNKFKLNFIDYIIFISLIIIFIIQSSDKYKFMIVYISRFFLGYIFIYFSYDKILDPQLFSNIVSNYNVIPFGLENLGALILPFIELIIGICLILGIFIDMAALVSLLLLVFFIFMIGQAYLRGKSIDCGCLLTDLSEASSSEKRIYMLKRILQDICFILYALIVKYRTKFQNDND